MVGGYTVTGHCTDIRAGNDAVSKMGGRFV